MTNLNEPQKLTTIEKVAGAFFLLIVIPCLFMVLTAGSKLRKMEPDRRAEMRENAKLHAQQRQLDANLAELQRIVEIETAIPVYEVKKQ
jgi:hypothetical protein